MNTAPEVSCGKNLGVPTSLGDDTLVDDFVVLVKEKLGKPRFDRC